ncbi:MAG: ABC transporter ATP-binding protein [bacterium]|nr:ABC transporter ATP-binding protein [bacterium]
MLTVRNLESGYGRLRVLKNISLHVRPGEIVAIIGANGAGKTTLVHVVAGLLASWRGELLFAGADITRTPAEAMAGLGCVLVPEGRQVFASMSVEENLLLGGTALRKSGGSSAIKEEMERQYARFPVLQERRSQLAGTLSGGEQQMLAMARALMARPRLVMMDEPSTGLAPLIVREIFSIIAQLRAEGSTVLLIEQNARAALEIADRGYVLETGKIIVQGKATELLANNDVQRAYLGREQIG